jgi:hypothetical protein
LWCGIPRGPKGARRLAPRSLRPRKPIVPHHQDSAQRAPRASAVYCRIAPPNPGLCTSRGIYGNYLRLPRLIPPCGGTQAAIPQNPPAGHGRRLCGRLLRGSAAPSARGRRWSRSYTPILPRAVYNRPRKATHEIFGAANVAGLVFVGYPLHSPGNCTSFVRPRLRCCSFRVRATRSAHLTC